MSDEFVICSSCKKPNNSQGRYCIGCGAILNPVYCSSCGTPNPDGVSQCLECGGSVPTLKGVHFSPVVNILEPTSAMVEERPPTIGNAPNQKSEAGAEEKQLLSRFRSILNRKQTA